LLQMTWFHFYGWIILHYVYILCFLSSFICCWVLRMIL
jgi:hypothetical protein